jgi:O-antigen/teichoic acid export membrane protein
MGAQLTTFAVFNIGVIILGFVYHVDRVTTGDFGAAMRLVYIAIMPIGALGLVTASHYAHGYQSPSPAEFRRAARIFLAGCLILGICGSAVLIPYGYKILELMSGRPMEASRSTLHIIGIGYLFVALYSPFSTVLPYMNAGRSYLLANSIALGIGLALNLLLIPHWGHIGASIAWLASVGSLVLIGYGFYRVQLRQARWASG